MVEDGLLMLGPPEVLGPWLAGVLSALGRLSGSSPPSVKIVTKVLLF